MTLIDFTLSNARRFYSSMGNPLTVKGLSNCQFRFLNVRYYAEPIKNVTDTEILKRSRRE